MLTVDDLMPGQAALRAALDTVAGTRQLLVLAALGPGPMRYSEIKRSVEGVSDRMLTQVLRRLAAGGLVERRARRTRLPHVEYELTALGSDVSTAVDDFVVAIMRLAPRMTQAATGTDPVSNTIDAE